MLFKRIISTKLFENQPTGLGVENVQSYILSIAMETRILHTIKKIEGIVQDTEKMLAVKFHPIDQLVIEEKMLKPVTR